MGVLKMSDNREYISEIDENGSINISEEVIAVIAGAAAMEVEGVHSLAATPGRDIALMLSKKSLARGVKIRVEDRVITIDVLILVEMGCAIAQVGAAVQKAVADAVESATGFQVAAVNVSICGIALKRDK